MKSSTLLACLLAFPVVAQDTIHLANGTVIDGAKVASFDVQALKYTKGGNQSVPTDQVVKVELGKFKDVFRVGLKDPDLMITKAREQLAEKNTLMAQLGMLSAAVQFFDNDNPAQAVATLDELQKAIPDAGVIADVYRQKFEYFLGQGQKGAASAVNVARKYQTEATGGAWPGGLLTEAEFFEAMAERAAGGAPKDFQAKLRAVIAKGASNNVVVANRGNVQLAHSLRENKDVEGARKIYEDLAKKDNTDSSTRAGALLGLGHIALDEGTAANKDSFRKALLFFLRVHLETPDSWPSLQAEALYHAVLAADKWRGNDFQYIMAKCRNVLFGDFASSEWAERMKAGR